MISSCEACHRKELPQITCLMMVEVKVEQDPGVFHVVIFENTYGGV